jgi:hypothetical protein
VSRGLSGVAQFWMVCVERVSGVAHILDGVC